MPESKIELLQAMPIFGGINEPVLEFLLERAMIVSVTKGGYFFKEGETGDRMYVIEEGNVAVIKSWQGNDYTLRQLAHGDSFGEMALIDYFPRSAAVRALSNARTIELTNTILYELYEKDLEQFTIIQMNMAREISRRLRIADEILFKAQVQDNSVNHEHNFRIF